MAPAQSNTLAVQQLHQHQRAEGRRQGGARAGGRAADEGRSAMVNVDVDGADDALLDVVGGR